MDFLTRICFQITENHLRNWYQDHKKDLTHGDWKKYHEAVTYLKRFRKGIKKEGPQRPSP